MQANAGLNRFFNSSISSLSLPGVSDAGVGVERTPFHSHLDNFRSELKPQIQSQKRVHGKVSSNLPTHPAHIVARRARFKLAVNHRGWTFQTETRLVDPALLRAPFPQHRGASSGSRFGINASISAKDARCSQNAASFRPSRTAQRRFARSARRGSVPRELVGMLESKSFMRSMPAASILLNTRKLPREERDATIVHVTTALTYP